MKLLVQSDDFGITPAVSCGILEAIKRELSVIQACLPICLWAGECVDMIRPVLGQISFGIDLNVSAGPPVLPPEQIPDLVQDKNGMVFDKCHESSVGYK